MTKESLIEIRKMIIESISENENLSRIDRMELMINLGNFLNPDNYENNIRFLKLINNK